MEKQNFPVNVIRNDDSVRYSERQINRNSNNFTRTSLPLTHQNGGDDGDALEEETVIDPVEEKKFSFAAKKTVAQGMMDVALMTANANQLKYLIQYQRSSPMFWIILFLIIISLLLQVAVGLSLIFKGRYDVKGLSKSKKAEIINNYVVVAVFVITVVNVFIAAFNIDPSTPPPPPPSILPPA